MKATRITIEIQGSDSIYWKYDSFADGPIAEWLVNVVPRSGTQNLNGTATIRVWEPK